MTVLFVDVVGFTAFAEGRDPERVRAVQQQYFDVAAEAITRHGGVIEKFIGDAVMAVWGTPAAHEDDAQRAVRAGLEVVKAVQALGHGLDARAGVVTAEAAVTIGATTQGMVAGDMVNTAARLQVAAEPGEVLADHATVQAAGALIAFEQAEDLILKGKSRPAHAWRAVAVRSGRSGDLVEPPFVGRAQELGRLKELLHAAERERRIRLVSITGPAGIGKSRLVQELGAYAAGLAHQIYWHTGRSPSYGEGLAFWAVGEMVRRRAGLAETDDEPTTRERIAATVEEIFGDAAERSWIEPAMLTLLGIGDGLGFESLFPAWRTFFERVAARGSAVLVFEDLQWADSGTLEFIDHLLDWSRNHPMLIITLARPEILDSRPGWGTARSNSAAIALEPMPDAHMHALLSGLLPGLPDDQLAPIVRRAGGIPLYAVEMVRALLAEGGIERRGDRLEPTRDLGSLPLPASLRSLIASRLDALDPDERAVLQHGAVLGQAFAVDALASVSGLPEQELEPPLRALVRRELLEIEADPRSPERGQYRFVQSLIREVAYDTLVLRERRERHLAAARHLEAAESDETAGALASHYLAAYRASEEGPEADAVAAQARLTLRAAAERAAALGAHEQAVNNYEHVLTITSDAREQADLLERAAAAAAVAGLLRAPELARMAVEKYQELGDAVGVAKATALLGDVLMDQGDTAGALEVLGPAADGVSRGTREEAELFSMLARARMRSDQNQPAVDAADRALAVSEREAYEDVAAAALINKGAALTHLGRKREAAALIEGGTRLADLLGLRHLELRGRRNLAVTLADGDPVRATEMARAGADLARRVGDRGAFVALGAIQADFSYAAGTADEWRDALAVIDDALSLAELPADRAELLRIRISYEAAQGSAKMYETLAAIDGVALEDPSEYADVPPVLSRAEVHASERKWDEAAAEAVWSVDRHRFTLGTAAPILLLAAVHKKEPALADRAARGGEFDMFRGAWSHAARTACEAVAVGLRGRHDEALERFEVSLDGFARLGRWWDWARTVVVAAVLMPDHARVLSWAARARAILAELGARPHADMLEDATSGPVADRRAGGRDSTVPASLA